MEVLNSIDVVCSVRNGEPHLAQMIESVLGQTYTSWSLNIIDDGSIDSTASILDYYCERDSRISWKKTNRPGRGFALNAAVEAGTARWVANIDADDIWLPSHLAQMARAVDGRPGFVVVGSLHRTFSDFNEVSNMLGDETVRDWQVVKDVTSECAYHNPINHSSVLMLRDALLNVGGYDPSRQSQFDYDLWVRLAINGGRLGRLLQMSVLKRVHDLQSFEARDRRAYVRSSLSIQQRFIQHSGGGIIAKGALATRRVWGVLPRGFRMAVRRLIRRDD